MNRKVLGIAVVLLAVAMLALPMISIARAYEWRRPTEIYDDLRVGGLIIPDSPVKVWKWGSIQFGRYTAHCPMLNIRWDFIDDVAQQSLPTGTAEYTVSYTINTDTKKGIANVKTKVTLAGGTFEGNMLWIGDLWLPAYDFSQPGPPFPTVLDTVSPNFYGTYTWYTYWRGTGAYEGWTITQSMHTENGMAEPAENYLIIR